MDRRQFIQSSAFAVAALPGSGCFLNSAAIFEPRYRLSLGQWTFNRAFRGVDGVTKRDVLEFPTMAGELGFEGVDYSGILLADHHTNSRSLSELNRRAADAGVTNVLILIDLYDALGVKDSVTRKANVEKYRPWLDAAATLGCAGVRVNPIAQDGLPQQEQARLLADGLSQLLNFSRPLKLDVMLENHGDGLQTDGSWLASVAKLVADPHCGTLPDFGNFQKDRTTGEFHDRYEGIAAMLPFAKAICAKSHDFDANGDECYADYGRLLRQVDDSSYRGWIEVEYEGPGHPPGTPVPVRKPARTLSESEGCIATVNLLRKHLGDNLSRKRP